MHSINDVYILVLEEESRNFDQGKQKETKINSGIKYICGVDTTKEAKFNSLTLIVQVWVQFSME